MKAEKFEDLKQEITRDVLRRLNDLVYENEALKARIKELEAANIELRMIALPDSFIN